jgi:hypothetical protein
MRFSDIISAYRLEGETPSKKNSRQVFRGGLNIPSKNYLKWLKAAEIELFRQGIETNGLLRELVGMFKASRLHSHTEDAC